MADGESYSFGDALPIDGLDDVSPGTNLLLSGPAMTGKRDVALDVLAAGRKQDDRSLVVTTDDPATQVRDEYRESGGRTSPSQLQIIDASGSARGGVDVEEDEGIHLVNSPSDLTGIGIAFTKAVEQIGTSRNVRLGFISISTLLQYVQQERAFSFFHVLTRRASAAGYLGLFILDPTMHEDRLVNVMTSIFDGVVELREPESGDRQVRVRGLDGVSSEWHDFPR